MELMLRQVCLLVIERSRKWMLVSDSIVGLSWMLLWIAHTHEVPSRFTTQYTTKKSLQQISTFSPLVTAQHTTCSNTRLGLLKMCIMMPETC